ncbi:MAG: hypothetical protein AB1499_13770 [Nitrospirota bacterium]
MNISKTLNKIAIALFILCTVGLSASEAELTVNNAEGTLLGILVGNSASNTIDVYVPSVDRTLNINLSTGEITGRDLYFESEDCSGTAYVLPESSYRIIRNGEEYLTGQKTGPVIIQTSSVYRSYNSSCELLDSVRYAVPAESIALPFSMPVSLPLSINIEKRWRE